jgi:hypothetical protein
MVLPVAVVDQELNIVAKVLDVLVCQIYPLSQIHASIDQLRSRFMIHVLNAVPLVGDNAIGIVGPVLSSINTIQVLFLARS